MTRVKICGITRKEDALHAVHAGADALGFVFYPKSPRCIDPEQARTIISALPPFVSAVGLFVNEGQKRIHEIASFSGIDVIQLHGDEAPQDCVVNGYRVVKALRVRDQDSLSAADRYGVSALLLDAWAPDQYGGTGRTFNWQLAARLAARRPVVLAGGLTPENVAQAIAAVHPYGVDVSSGVESSPGRKDPAKLAAFIANAKRAKG